jgi:hypothetical protein
MENISKHISFKEATVSNTAKQKGINNTPDAKQLENMKTVAEKVFEPLRAFSGGPIVITSFFRSPELNKAIGGSATSEHCLGMAIDLVSGTKGISNKDLFNYIKDKLVFSQLIWEFGNDLNPEWIHVSYNKDNLKKEVLKAVKENGKTVYKKYNS